MSTARQAGSPWRWLPSLYFAEGLPFVVAMTVSVVMYSRLGISNAEVALYTSWLYLPWIVKPLWSPLVELLKTRRSWIIMMQLLVGAGFACVALTLPGDNFFRYSLAVFWLIAFSSATHDIAADGFYMLALDDHQQAWFVGIRNTFFRIAMISGQGGFVVIAGYLEASSGDNRLAWSITFYLMAALFLGLAAWHRRVLPEPAGDTVGDVQSLRRVMHGFLETFASFFRKPRILLLLAFLLLYRFAEAQLVKIAALFLLDERGSGGLQLSTADVGITYGTVGVLLLTAGGILGGFLAARHGLKRWIGWMVAAINLPNAVYLLLAIYQPQNPWLVNLAVGVEQFGYGLGFTAYTLYMIYIARGEHRTAHFSICTGFMALGMMLPGMFSGALQEWLGYEYFFLWILLATLPSFAVVALVPLDADFGRRGGRGEPGSRS